MYKDYQIEHIFNSIYEEQFQEKFMEQPLQTQYEILSHIKRLLKTLCDKIQHKTEQIQLCQDPREINNIKLEEDSELKDYLKQIESVIQYTTLIPSTFKVKQVKEQSKKPLQKKRNNLLFEDQILPTPIEHQILYEVLRIEPIVIEEPLQIQQIQTNTRKLINMNSIQIINPSLNQQSTSAITGSGIPTQQLIRIQQSGGVGGFQEPFSYSSINTAQVLGDNSQNRTLQTRKRNLKKYDSIIIGQNNEQSPLVDSNSYTQLNIPGLKQPAQQTQQSNSRAFEKENNGNKSQSACNNINIANENSKNVFLQRTVNEPFMKLIITNIEEEQKVFNDDILLYEKMADFLRDCIDSFRAMVRQGDITKFDDLTAKKFLRYSTKVRFNISELCEQFRNFERSIEKKSYWKCVLSKTQSSLFNNKAQNSQTKNNILNPQQETKRFETKKQRIGRLQLILSDKFNFSKRQSQTRESKVELNTMKFEEQKKLLMDSHLSPSEVLSIPADNRRKLALQRLRNPFIEPFKNNIKSQSTAKLEAVIQSPSLRRKLTPNSIASSKNKQATHINLQSISNMPDYF